MPRRRTKSDPITFRVPMHLVSTLERLAEQEGHESLHEFAAAKFTALGEKHFERVQAASE